MTDVHGHTDVTELTVADLFRGDDNDPRCEIEVVCPECTEEQHAGEEDPATHPCDSRARWVTTMKCTECGQNEPLIACDDHYDMIRAAVAEGDHSVLGVSGDNVWRAL